LLVDGVDAVEIDAAAAAPTAGARELLRAAPSAAAEDAPGAGPELPLTPLTCAGGAVLYRAGGALRRLELAPRVERPLPVASPLAELRCAGDRAAPCLARLVERDALRYLSFDPARAVLGAELYRGSPGGAPHAALSPDGKTLALARGRELLLVTADGAAPRRHLLDPDAEPTALAWVSDGQSLMLSTFSASSPRFAVLRATPGGLFDRILESETRWYGRAVASPDSRQLAVEARDARVDLWLVDGL
jgi:hypothetical protein